MIVIVLENVPDNLKGKLSLWLLEIRCGIYIGNVSAKTRDMIWKLVKENIRKGNAVMVWKTNTESGYDFKTLGKNKRYPIELNGMKLVSYISNNR